MTTGIITRIRYPELYSRMMFSARETSYGDIRFLSSLDNGQPKLAESYNLMGSISTADILLFVHDDVIFLSHGWDRKIREAFKFGFNVAGAVGSQKYEGGMIFDAGKQYSAGKVVGRVDGKRVVKLMDNQAEIEPVKVVDGMFLAVERKHFLKTGFDQQFDGLFYYDIDLCLRSNCCVVDILIAHEKPDNLKGSYPKDMKPMEDYVQDFNKKHGFNSDFPIGDQRCDSIEYADYCNLHKEMNYAG